MGESFHNYSWIQGFETYTKLNHTSNAKSSRTFNITYIVLSIVTQFYQKLKHLFMKMKVELHRPIIPLLIITCLGECLP